MVVRALSEAGVNIPAVLAELRDSDDYIVDVTAGNRARFRLHWNEGTVFSRIDMGNGVTWHENRLGFENAPRSMNRLAAGSALAQTFSHPVLDDRLVVVTGSGAKGGSAIVYCNGATLDFNADDGRTWAI